MGHTRHVPRQDAPALASIQRARELGSRRGLFALGWCFVLALASACAGCIRPAVETDSISTVVLITIDTWRADATGFLGGRVPSPTPFLDSLASRSLVASNALTPVPLTGPSHWSMLTGRWPWRDGVRVNGDIPVGDRSLLLTELLSKAGWTTGGFVSASVLSGRRGFGTGFDHFDDEVMISGKPGGLEVYQRRGDLTLERAVTWLDQRAPEERVFLWMHLFDPHAPYSAPREVIPGTHGDYLAEVAFADQIVAELWRVVGGLGRGNALWVVLSDHGEGLGEHDEATHGFLLHGATSRIPLLIHGPGVRPGRVTEPTSTVDVPPTVVALLGLEVDSRLDGRDLLSGDWNNDRAIPQESLLGLRGIGLSPVYGLRTVEWFWEGSRVDRLWNVAADQKEREEVAEVHPAVVAELRRRRRDFGMPEPRLHAALDRDRQADLAALGYLSGRYDSGEGDVREFMPAGGRWFHEAATFQALGQLAEADASALKFLAVYPESHDMWHKAGMIAVGMGDMAEAARRFQRAVELEPGSTAAHLNLGNAFLALGRLEDAERSYERVLAEDAEDLFALYNLGLVRGRRGRIPEAARVWRIFLQKYPNHERAAFVMDQLEQWSREGEI